MIICVFFFEMAFRITDIGGLTEGRFPATEGPYEFVKHTSYNPFLIFGPNINRKFKQDSGGDVYFNSQGFRQKELLPLEKPADEIRAFALGGSTTEAIPNGQNMHYCGEANQILGEYTFNGKHFHCINSGTSGYSTAHSLIRIQFDLLRFNPDIITVMHNINDLTVNFFPYDDRNNYANKYLYESYAPTNIVKNSFLRKSRFVVFFYSKINKIKERFFAKKIQTNDGNIITSTMRFTSAPIELRSEAEFKNNLIAISRICKAHNITLVLMSQPAVFSEEKLALAFGSKNYNDYILYPEIETFKKMFEEYNSVIESIAEEEGVYFIDMYNLLGHNETYFVDALHYSAEGEKEFGRIYAENLAKITEKELLNVKQ